MPLCLQTVAAAPSMPTTPRCLHKHASYVLVVAYQILRSCRSVCGDSTCSAVETTDVTPHLHIKLTPQGCSDVSLQLTVQDHAASSLSNTTLLSKQEQRDYQDQLHKAQQTLLPQVPQVMVYSKRYSLNATKSAELVILRVSTV